MNVGWKYLIPAVKVPIVIFLIMCGLALIPLKFQPQVIQKQAGVDETDTYYLWTADAETFKVPKFPITKSFPDSVVVKLSDKKVSFTISITYYIDKDNIAAVIKNFNIQNGYDEMSQKVFELVTAKLKNRASRYAFPLMLVEQEACDNSLTHPFGITLDSVVFTSEIKEVD